MAIGYSPKIVTDGLTVYVDAANTKSYPGSGNDWNDLMGYFNLTGLVGGGGTEPTYNALAGGCFDFDGSDRLQLTHATKFDLAGDFAIECWMYFDQVGQECSGMVWLNTTSLDELQFAVSNTSQVGFAVDGSWKGYSLSLIHM